MYLLNNKPLALGLPFKALDGTQYPSNWLQLSTEADRAAIGITEEPDPPTYDQRFYWGVGNPKDLTELKKQWVAQTKATAGALLSQSDWFIVRQAETGKQTPASILLYRLAVRDISNTKESAIEATATTDELAAYITSSLYTEWPTEDQPVDTSTP